MTRSLPPKAWSLKKRIQYLLALALKLSVAVAAAVALGLGLWELFFISLLSLGLMFLPELIESWVKLRLPIEFNLVLVLFVYAALFLGAGAGAYDAIWWWDLVMHAVSGFIMSFAGFLLLYVQVLRHKISASPGAAGLIIFSFGLSFSSVWEIFQYAMDTVFGTDMQLASLHDTMWDLIVAAVAAAIMGYIGAKFVAKPSEGRVVKWLNRFIDANPGLAQKGGR